MISTICSPSLGGNAELVPRRVPLRIPRLNLQMDNNIACYTARWFALTQTVAVVLPAGMRPAHSSIDLRVEMPRHGGGMLLRIACAAIYQMRLDIRGLPVWSVETDLRRVGDRPC